MKSKSGLFFLGLLTLIGLYGIVESLTFRYVQAKALPLFASVVVFATSAIELSRGLRQQHRRPGVEEEAPARAESKAGWRRLWITVAWVVGFSLGIYLMGFLVAIPLFVGSYVKTAGRSWLISIGSAAIISILVYIMFVVGLKMPLYRGLLFGAR